MCVYCLKFALITPVSLQTTLTQLYEWRDQLSDLPSHLPTPYSMVCVVTGEMVGVILPRLGSILDRLKTKGVEEARKEGQRVLAETKRHSEVRMRRVGGVVLIHTVCVHVHVGAG